MAVAVCLKPVFWLCLCWVPYSLGLKFDNHPTILPSDRLQELQQIYHKLSNTLHQHQTERAESSRHSLLATLAAGGEDLPERPPPEDVVQQPITAQSAAEDIEGSIPSAKRREDVRHLDVKRQQAWETAYGKRAEGEQKRRGDVRRLDVKRQQAWENPYGKRAKEEQKHRVWPSTDGDSRAFDSAVSMLNKRQQGWEIAYGKRGNDVISGMAKRQQGWDTPYGKRSMNDVIRIAVKRQQGWCTPYGKRASDDVLLDQTRRLRRRSDCYRKRGSQLPQLGLKTVTNGRHSIQVPNVNPETDDVTPFAVKRQQGWHVPYGKRMGNENKRADLQFQLTSSYDSAEVESEDTDDMQRRYELFMAFLNSLEQTDTNAGEEDWLLYQL